MRLLVVILGTIAHYAHSQTHTCTCTYTHTQIIINLRYKVKLHSSVVDEEYVSSFEEPHLCKCSKVHSSSTSNCDIIIRGGTVKQLQLSAENQKYQLY